MNALPEPQTDDLQVLINLLPQRVADYLNASSDLPRLIEIVMDLGRIPVVRFDNSVHRLDELGEMSSEDINFVIRRVGDFNTDNRAGIGRTLHRVSAIRNRKGTIVGLTCRIGRAVEGTVDIIKDIIESGQNCLFVGPPGIGKTTILRETARILADVNKRVVVVDTSNEIAGDGDVPHPGIGEARRMQVPSPDDQHAVMIEAVENHMPEVIVVDEIGTEQETRAARTIAERGVQLVATAHGYNLESLIKNPILSNLIGGVQTVTLGDEEAKHRGTNKSVLERKTLPTFDVVIELRSRHVFAIYNPVANFVDAFLKDDPIDPEVRKRDLDGEVSIEQQANPIQKTEKQTQHAPEHTLNIYPFGISTGTVAAAIHALQVPVVIAKDLDAADLVITLKSKIGPKSKISQMMQGRNIPLHVIKSPSDITNFLRAEFHLSETDEDIQIEALREVERACKVATDECRVLELSPRDRLVRRLQHQKAFEAGLNSMSVGEDPNRRVRLYPRGA